MRLSSALAAIGAAVTLTIFTAVPAQAAPPVGVAITQCGQTLPNGPAYLAKNLTCTVGLVMPTPLDEPVQTTLDMRGHRLRGPGSGTGITVAENLPFSSRLTVRNGRIDHWGTGVETSYTDVTMTKVRIDHNQVGLFCGDSSGCTFTDSTFADNRVGTDSNAASSSFTRTVFRGNDVASRADGSCCNGYTADQNLYVGNRIGVSVAIETDVTVTNSTFARNDTGITSDKVVQDFIGWIVTVEGNRFIGNRNGIYLTPTAGFDTATIGDNLAVRNTRYGIFAPGAIDAGGNREARNGKPCVGVVCGPAS